ncbi:MAG: fused MFS/spermidine synthase [Thermoleophilia bacterium]|nr:fused MFS/spermidine synthase [Thermoleophilia bacterium]
MTGTPPGKILYPLVFAGGMTTMATEMAGSRLLAPFFGNSLFIWANLIGLILIYLTLGYYLGGKLADRRPEPRLLFSLTMTAAVTIALLPFVARPIMRVAVRGLEQVSAGAFLGSFTITVLLFALPITILGMVTPFAIRLRMTGIETAGNVAGGMYALSTVGSIIGTFLPVLLLIPLIGTRNTMLLFAGLLAAVSAVGLGRGFYAGAPMVILAGLMIPQGAIKPDPDTLFEIDSPYQYVQVVKRGNTTYLKLNEGWAVHSIYNPDEIFTAAYWDYFLVGPWFGNDREPGRVLNIGSAAGTMARQYSRFYPDTLVDGVELDPDVVEAGKRFFDMDFPNLEVFVADGRPFLKTSARSYDFIAVDAYRQPYIPFYLTTREFFQETRDSLNAGGSVMINVAHAPGDERLADAIGATMREVFPSVYSIRAGSFNLLLIGTREPSRTIDMKERMALMPPEVQELALEIIPRVTEVKPGGRILTDDKAPVEWLTDQMIIHYVTQ